jgi:hypothetical protein
MKADPMKVKAETRLAEQPEADTSFGDDADRPNIRR